MNAPSDLSLFLGRFHPLLVHAPIGSLLLLALLEGLSRLPRFRYANANAGLILAFTTPLALLTALCGWLLSLAGGYDTRLLQWHLWTGIGTALTCALTALLYRLDRKRAYRYSLFASLAILTVASHFGGSLTHGRGYLAQYAPKPLRLLLGSGPAGVSAPLGDASTQNVFTTSIQPFLQQKCVGCHGPEKAKGNLRLDSLAALLTGGNDGPAILPGRPTESSAVKRMLLPITDQDHMPPEGKPQPSAEELAWFKSWVEAGAPTNQTPSAIQAMGSVPEQRPRE